MLRTFLAQVPAGQQFTGAIQWSPGDNIVQSTSALYIREIVLYMGNEEKDWSIFWVKNIFNETENEGVILSEGRSSTTNHVVLSGRHAPGLIPIEKYEVTRSGEAYTRRNVSDFRQSLRVITRKASSLMSVRMSVWGSSAPSARLLLDGAPEIGSLPDAAQKYASTVSYIQD